MLFRISPGRSRKRNGCVAWVEDMMAVVVDDVSWAWIILAKVVWGCRKEYVSLWNVAVVVGLLGKEVAQEVLLWNDACQ